jgi:hypothetical protein
MSAPGAFGSPLWHRLWITGRNKCDENPAAFVLKTLPLAVDIGVSEAFTADKLDCKIAKKLGSGHIEKQWTFWNRAGVGGAAT